jgi:bifunctional DNase/RNase
LAGVWYREQDANLLAEGQRIARSESANQRRVPTGRSIYPQEASPKACFFEIPRYTSGMKNDVVPVQIRGILPANSGCALFVGNDEKVFVINVEPQMGQIISNFLRDAPKERPLTHDLMQSVFKGFTITVERVIITELRNSTYFARLILQQQNEIARKIVEIDARPSDCLALASAQKRPIFVTQSLFDQVEDMSEVLDKINESGNEPE